MTQLSKYQGRQLTPLFILTTTLLCSSVAVGQEVTLTMQGHVPTHCELAVSSTTLQVRSNESASAGLNFSCNSPMTLTLYSQNGGLKHNLSDVLAPYFLTVDVPEVIGATAYNAKELVQGKQLRIDEPMFVRQGMLTVELAQPLYYAGQYHDQVRLEVTPKQFGVSQ